MKSVEAKATLPTFLICGAQKAGTTALYSALQRHPDVCMSRPKETEFFSWRFDRGWEWFGTKFAHYNGEAAIGEASTRTMPTPQAPERICERLPKARLIFVLRDPVERAHSAFWFYVSTGILPAGTDFSTFIRNEGHPLRHEIIQYGQYEKHLRRFKNYFNEDQLLVLPYADLRENATSLVHAVNEFIGVAPQEQPNSSVKKRNVTQHPSVAFAWAKGIWKSVQAGLHTVAPGIEDTLRKQSKRLLLRGTRPPLSGEDVQYLYEIYRPTVEAMQLETNLDFSYWTR